ncbi:MAG: ATP-binding cassette domain-containing protein [Eggerthellales bacterium]|nr:ATP-binding cassette domain-containing protein [Eggerthellales bacterium]
MLEARDVSFAYKKGREIYCGINLSVSPDERVALQAPSGFGKTTLCQILSGYLQPSAGQVLVDGEPLPKRGVCPVQLIWQHPEKVLDPRMRMRESLAEAGAADPRIIEALGIQRRWMDRFPHELSGGEMQRFCIARALTARPKYLIADEISTMLDAVTQAQLWDFLVRETSEQGIGMVLVSHSPDLTARVATRVVQLG